MNLPNEIVELRDISKRFGLVSTDETGLNFIKLFSDKTSHLRDKTKYEFNRNSRMDSTEHDLTVCVAKARFAISRVLKYREDGLASCEWSPEEGYARYNPSPTDWLFYYYLDDSYSNLYSAWERIAGYLAIFWPAPSDEKVFFVPQIDRIIKSVPMPHPPSLIWLQGFIDGGAGRYTQMMNQHRKKIIHTECSNGSYFFSWLKSHASQEEVEALKLERDSRPDKLIECYSDLIQGTNNMLSLIESQFPKSTGVLVP